MQIELRVGARPPSPTAWSNPRGSPVGCSPTHRRGLPVSRCSLYPHVRRQYPGEASGCYCRSLPLTCQPSPRLPDRVGLRIAVFGVCSTFTARCGPRSRQATQGGPLVLYTEGFDRFATSRTTPIATGWKGSCRVGLSPTEKAHVFTAHGNPG
jgi:hypothetical protein